MDDRFYFFLLQFDITAKQGDDPVDLDINNDWDIVFVSICMWILSVQMQG